jgi:ABC-type sugar transport system ATPase subunit
MSSLASETNGVDGSVGVVSANGIHKTYGAVRALVDVDLQLQAGEIVALAGENGSGKSTMAKILAGVIEPDQGELAVDGTSCRFARPRDALDHGIALVAQELTAVPGLSVGQNILLSRVPRSLSVFRPRRFEKDAQQFLDLVGLDVDLRVPFDSLRSGEREFVEVAKALATLPRVLILDEATSRFAEHDVKTLFEVLKKLRAQGMSTVLITHRLSEICELCDRAVVLRDGHLVGELPRVELSEERLSSMMVGRDLEDFFHKRTVAVQKPLLRVDELLVEGSPEPVSLDVRSGEIVGLAGLVGSGRTELIETIFGARKTHGGSVSIEGETIPPGSPMAALNAGIAFVPEDRHKQGLDLGASIRSNVAMGTWQLLSTNKRREREISVEAVNRLQIRPPVIDASVRRLSGGNQQKVVIGRSLARRPRVLLLDEPTRGIDVGAKEEIFELIGEMVAEGLGILLASSELPEILGLCDRIVVMHERRFVAELTRAEATEERIAFLSAGGSREPLVH